MTAAYRLKGIGWFGSCVVVVLGFYLVSLQVASERKKLEQVNKRIVAAERDIRALETEFGTRANLVQLERWNGDTLALSAPTASQFVQDEAALAALDVNAVPGADAPVRTAALVVPSGVPVFAPPQPAMTLIAANAPIAAPAAATAPAAAAVSATAPAAAAPRSAPVAAVRTAAVAAKARPQAVALLDRKLLSDSTLGDILSSARAEAGRKR